MNPIFNGEAKNGIIKLDDQERYNKWISTLDGRVQVIVKKFRNTRSNRQNKYYWKVIVGTLSEETGHSTNEIHQALKLKFLTNYELTNKIKLKLPDKVIAVLKWIEKTFGVDISFTRKQEKLQIIGSTTKLSTKEMEEYLSQIRVWASSDLNIYLPEPNEVQL